MMITNSNGDNGNSIPSLLTMIPLRGMLVTSEGIELPDGERIKEVDHKEYKYLGVLQLDKTMNNELKENIGNEYIGRVKLICKSILNAGNFIYGYRCDEVHRRNYRLEKRGTLVHGPEIYKDDIEQMFAPKK